MTVHKQENIWITDIENFVFPFFFFLKLADHCVGSKNPYVLSPPLLQKTVTLRL